MKKILCCLLPCWLIFSGNAQAAPGEFWELTTTMEGMGMSMPTQTSKECIPTKDDGSPAGVDKDCTISDLKGIPNGSSWKMSCKDGTTGSGKQTHTKDTITSDILMNTTDGNMKMSLKGKRVGGSCETDAKVKTMIAESCDLKNKKAVEVIGGAIMYTGSGADALCASKKEQFCGLVKPELPKDMKVYDALQWTLKSEQEKSNKKSNVVSACGLNVEAARQSLCKTNANNRTSDGIGFLEAYCPAEAKALRQKIREETCAGRQFTSASDKEKCISGKDFSGDTVESSSNSSMPAEQSTEKSGNVATDAVKEGTKALKGLKDAFGF